jgi:hypothetical protein
LRARAVVDGQDGDPSKVEKATHGRWLCRQVA